MGCHALGGYKVQKEDGYGNKYTGTFWSYPSFIRCATDGMEGLLDCVRLACAYNLPQKNEWMDTLCKFGEFLLVKARNEGDGSFYRAYDITGDFVRDVKVMGPSIHEQNKLQANSKTNTLIPVRFLVKMYELTGDNRYYKRALAAGEYGYKAFFQDLGLFIGGTPDHSNICDKEAGVYAMYAFTSLYMMTKDKKWLEAAEYAAIFAFSHTYCYDFKIQGDEKENIFKNGGVIGQSIISVGTSDSDNYNAFIYYELFKMYILTQDPFYKKGCSIIGKKYQASDGYRQNKRLCIQSFVTGGQYFLRFHIFICQGMASLVRSGQFRPHSQVLPDFWRI